ncbi:glyoxalase/bleomycin resistance protein/dioxygenase superfamily protein [Actinocorallia herbida]|uniref:Glyoxalase/bleomycin resistance protein/dioxygenase superfamily protein n=1 Tax=Actinocorallia herbida TaxID=58109 RepID=A0A3N1CW64_9ACTN|nr:VOC family protein [Actinocorallia herbida]ROO85504.1 glyoxalase/bleomycin resistance protein/dioxygenase superfamily protein [Actinocorallia herbida]
MPAEDATFAGAHAVPWPLLDHLAIGVRRWSDAYARFATHLGGRFHHAGEAPEYAPCQLEFGTGMRLEFIAPSEQSGFMDRFLSRRGPAPHHLTFKVPSMDETAKEFARLKFPSFGGHPDLPGRRETFVHPKDAAIGTLVQVIESDDSLLETHALTVAPADFPSPAAESRTVSLVGLTAADLGRAHDLLGRALLGDVTEDGDGWFFVTWGRGRALLVREAAATPCAPELWRDAPATGVGFALFGPEDLTASALTAREGELTRLPADSGTGLPVWLL